MAAAALPYILLGGTTLLQLNAQQEAADQKRRILNNQMTQNEKATDRAISLVQQEGLNFSPEARQQALAAQEQATYDQAAKDLKLGAGGGAIDTAGGQSNVSAGYVKALADKELGETSRLSQVAREQAKVRAPIQLGQTDSLRRADMASNLQNIFGSAGNMNRAAGLDAQSVEEPLYGSIAGALGNVGSQYLQSEYLDTKYPQRKYGIQWGTAPDAYDHR